MDLDELVRVVGDRRLGDELLETLQELMECPRGLEATGETDVTPVQSGKIRAAHHGCSIRRGL